MMKTKPNKSVDYSTRPLLKWAGGKTQILDEIMAKMPSKYGRVSSHFSAAAHYFSHYSQKKELLLITIQR